MNIIKYEFLKILKNKFVFVFSFAFLLLNSIIFIAPWEREIEFLRWQADRNNIERPVRDFLINATREEYDWYMEQISLIYQGDWFSDWYTYGWVDFVLSNENEPGILMDNFNRELATLQSINLWMRFIHPQTVEFRNNIVNTARHLGGYALQNNNYFEVRRNLDVIERFSGNVTFLRAYQYSYNFFSLHEQNGWRRLLSYQWGNIFSYIMVLLVSSQLFSKEEKRLQLIFSTANGRSKNIAAKYIVGTVFAFVFSIVFSFSNFVSAIFVYGLSGGNAHIISLTPMMLTPLNMRINETVVFFGLSYAFGAIFLNIIFVSISVFFKKQMLTYFVSALFLVGSYFYHLLIGSHSILPFHSIVFPDITVWTRQLWFWERYRVANLFGFPVFWYWVFASFWIVMCAILITITLIYSENLKRIIK